MGTFRNDAKAWERDAVRWLGIDEAGYGPNLGPLVMSAVVAEADGDSLGPTDLAPPERFWDDLRATVARAGGRGAGDRLWVDDSKAILKGGKGRDQLIAGCLAVLDAVGLPLPSTASGLIEALCGDESDAAELDRWLTSGATSDVECRMGSLIEATRSRLACKPLAPPCGTWRIAAVRTAAVGPQRFNEGLGRFDSKAGVHFEAFARLLRWAWELSADGRPMHVCGDKHGGRHYYLEPLLGVFPDAWIDRGVEGPELSEYTVRTSDRTMHLRLTPRADARDGFVALASIVSKTLREEWMDVFNAFWARHVPGLRPTAGYPVDAARFRRAVEPSALALGIEPRLWWRER
ncbi:hypothetical protein [Paludisphaera borealis]|uniref:Uncharacterized protein n=1 Tax=Paludisphaera borealis TaxID=1387353 RepID=A0A1U7CMK3_9BACT|nr:hypothetical protein [Paludisphaera borealis]APW60162.1 hypothetical protein BSF38_01628 [Paludisphaera borealis]